MRRSLNTSALLALGVVTTLMLNVACAQMGNQSGAQGDAAVPAAQAQGENNVSQHARMFAEINRAVAFLMPTQGNDVRGKVEFEQVPENKVRVTYQIEGLEPNSTHGFHVHQYGDLSAPDGTSLGGHYDPEGHPHNLPKEQPRHAGDMGNIEANAQGVAEGSITVDNLTIAGLENPILGRGVVVHAQRDTGEGESGEAGPRLGVGVIGVAQPPSESEAGNTAGQTDAGGQDDAAGQNEGM